MKNTNADTQKSKNKVLSVLLKTVITVIAAALAFTVAAIADLLLRASDIHMPILLLVAYLLPASVLPVIWVKHRKKYMKIWLLFAAFCLVVFGADFAVVKHDESLKVDTYRYLNIIEELPDYRPFEEDSLIVKAESETLNLTGDLPVLDGTVAFFPLYSAFMNAVYPETEEFFYGSFDHVQSWGYEELADKNTDIFITLEQPSEEQIAKAASRGVSYEFTTIGTEALVFITDIDNPVDNLTTEQIKGIYSGQITNWKELGGKNKKIEAYQNPADSANQKMMERFMAELPLMAAPSEKIYDELYAWVEDISVYRNKSNAIGFAFSYCVKDNTDIKILSVDGVEPTRENIEDGSYKLVTPVYAVTYEDNPNENLDKMLDWILSDEGRYIIEETGYVGPVAMYLE